MCEDEAASRKVKEATKTDIVVKMEATPDLGFAAMQSMGAPDKPGGSPNEPSRLPDVLKGAPDDPGHTTAPLDVWIKVEHFDEDAAEYASPPASPLPKAEPPDSKVSLNNAAAPPPAHACHCGRAFRTGFQLAHHKNTHNRTPSHKCDKCGRMFTVESNLHRHQRTTCQRPPPTCTICCKVFKREYYLQSHMKKHETERPFPCPQCDLAFKFNYALSRHMLIHENLKLFPCEVCGKRFTTAALIKPHMRTHTKEKPFECPLCLRKFSHKHDMQRHCLGHNKIKHLKCEVCHKEFRTESRLKYHMRVHWTDNKPFKCLHCKKSYSHTQNIMRHYKKKHPNEEYFPPDTDAGVATKAWEALIQKKQSESVGGYIVPDMELDKVENGVVSEVNDFGLEDGYSENENDEEVTPEIVFVEPKVEQESSDSESSENDEKD